MIATTQKPPAKPTASATESIEPLGFDLVCKNGCQFVGFTDDDGFGCSVQESTLGSSGMRSLWIGIDDPKPEIQRSKAAALGFKLDPSSHSDSMIHYPIPSDVFLTTRMHLNEVQVRGLIARLTTWLETGRINPNHPER